MTADPTPAFKGTDIATALRRDCPHLRVLDAPDIREAHSADHTEDLQFLPDLVVEPTSTEDVMGA